MKTALLQLLIFAQLLLTSCQTPNYYTVDVNASSPNSRIAIGPATAFQSNSESTNYAAGDAKLFGTLLTFVHGELVQKGYAAYLAPWNDGLLAPGEVKLLGDLSIAFLSEKYLTGGGGFSPDAYLADVRLRGLDQKAGRFLVVAVIHEAPTTGDIIANLGTTHPVRFVAYLLNLGDGSIIWQNEARAGGTVQAVQLALQTGLAKELLTTFPPPKNSEVGIVRDQTGKELDLLKK